MYNGDDLREAITLVLADNGVQDHVDCLHSWRCEYPDRYECNCIAILVDDLVKVVEPRLIILTYKDSS